MSVPSLYELKGLLYWVSADAFLAAFAIWLVLTSRASSSIVSPRHVLPFRAPLPDFCDHVLLLGRGLGRRAARPPRNRSLLVLRNGEVLAGRVARDDDYYRVVLPDGELRVR